MTPPVRETPAPPPLQPGARFAAARARARETYRLLAVACTLAVVLTAATVVGLVPLAVGWAVHGLGPRDPWGIARRSAVGGGVGAALLVGMLGSSQRPPPLNITAVPNWVTAAAVGFLAFVIPAAAMGLLLRAGRRTGWRPFARQTRRVATPGGGP